jgi:hypothetical protein
MRTFMVVMTRAMSCFSLLAIVVGAVSLLGDAASAKPFALQGTYSRDTVKKDCDAAGGTFSDTANGGYGCSASGGSVGCSSKGNCVGDCQNCPPSRRKPGIKNFLIFGDPRGLQAR